MVLWTFMTPFGLCRPVAKHFFKQTVLLPEPNNPGMAWYSTVTQILRERRHVLLQGALG